jgi:CheY-specific phosphatase CheX
MSSNPLPSLQQTREWLDSSVLDVLGTMAHVVAFPHPSSVTPPDSKAVYCSTVGFKGDANVSISFFAPEHSAALLASKFLDMPESEVDSDMIKDVLGEFANMAVGAIKSRFSDSGVNCVMTIPNVSEGVALPGNPPENSERVLFEIGQDWVLSEIVLA